MNHYLVSVAIPTRNRQYYAIRCVRQVYELGRKIQIVITDNSDDTAVGEALSDIIDGDRVIYSYEPEKISAVGNYDRAASLSGAEYFIAIGDDDLVLPNVTELAAWMKKNNIDAVRTSRALNYRWPSKERKNGRLLAGPFSCQKREFCPYDGVIRILKHGCQGYLHTDMAGSYHALVSMKCMHMVYEKSGYYFYGFSPDIYSAVCLSLLPGIRAVYMDYPVSIPGWCPESASYRAWKHAAVSSVEEAVKKYSSAGYQWEELVPRYYAPETTWADTVLKAVKSMGRDDLIKRYFNRESLVKAVYYNQKEYQRQILGVLNEEEKRLLYNKGGFFNANFPDKKKTVFSIASDILLRGQRRYYRVNDNQSAIRNMKHFMNRRSERAKWKQLMDWDTASGQGTGR